MQTERHPADEWGAPGWLEAMLEASAAASVSDLREGRRGRCDAAVAPAAGPRLTERRETRGGVGAAETSWAGEPARKLPLRRSSSGACMQWRT